MGSRATLKFRKFKVAFGFKFTVNLRGKPLKIMPVCILQLKTLLRLETRLGYFEFRVMVYGGA